MARNSRGDVRDKHDGPCDGNIAGIDCLRRNGRGNRNAQSGGCGGRGALATFASVAVATATDVVNVAAATNVVTAAFVAGAV